MELKLQTHTAGLRTQTAERHSSVSRALHAVANPLHSAGLQTVLQADLHSQLWLPRTS